MNQASYNFYEYVAAIRSASLLINQAKIDQAFELLVNNIQNVVIFGNGGSAAISDHFCCDFVKGVRSDTNLKPKCTSLVSNGPLSSALANDTSFERIFSEQIDYHEPSLAIAVSSSGNSKNILRGLEVARSIGTKTIALVGFDGGEVFRTDAADVVLHVKSDNYGIVEDSHMMILHSLVQKIRKDNSINPESLKL